MRRTAAAPIRRSIARSPRLALRLIGVLAGKLSVAHDRIGDLALADTKHRLVNAILMAQAAGNPGMTHDELAGMIGVRREEVTKALHDLEGSGVLRLDPGNHTIEVLQAGRE